MTDYNKLWDEIDTIVKKEYALQTQQEYEKTLGELQKEWKTTRGKTKEIIDILVVQGKMNQRKCRGGNGVVIWVYSPRSN